MTRRTSPVTALVLAVGLLLSGCSFMDGAQPQASDPSPTPSASDEPSASTEAPSDQPERKRKADKVPSESPTTQSKSPSPSRSAPAQADPAEPPTSYAEAAAHVNSAERSGGARQLQRFESPDGNFHCVLDHEFIRPGCEIGDRSIEDAELCEGGMARYMGRIELTRGGWRPFCNSDTIREHGATRLQVGAVAAWPDRGISCVLEKIGITCVSSGRQGFFLGSGEYRVF